MTKQVFISQKARQRRFFAPKNKLTLGIAFLTIGMILALPITIGPPLATIKKTIIEGAMTSAGTMYGITIDSYQTWYGLSLLGLFLLLAGTLLVLRNLKKS